MEIMHLNTSTSDLILLRPLNCVLKQSEICILVSESLLVISITKKAIYIDLGLFYFLKEN